MQRDRTEGRATTRQLIALAEFERTYGQALHVPAGPRRDRLARWAGYGVLVVQSDRSYMDPVVAVIETDGRTEEVDRAAR